MPKPTLMTIPEIAYKHNVSTARLRRAAKKLGFDTERGGTFGPDQVKEMLKKVAETGR